MHPPPYLACIRFLILLSHFEFHEAKLDQYPLSEGEVFDFCFLLDKEEQSKYLVLLYSYILSIKQFDTHQQQRPRRTIGA